jgi:drug/metabolite transporter (DMT)-like permease
MNPKLSLAIGILCTAFAPIFVKLAGEPAITVSFYRIFVAWLCLLPYCLAKGLLKISRKDLGPALLGGLVFAADILVWNMSILKISATVSTLLANLVPVWVGLLSFLILKKNGGRLFWIGTLVAIFGMVILIGYRNILHLQINIGVFLALLSSFLYGVYILLTKNILQRISTVTFMFYNMLAAWVFLLVIAMIQGAELVHIPASSWLYLAATGLVCQLLGWLNNNYAIKKLPSTKVSVTLLSQTVVTGLLAAIILHERLGLAEIAGSLIVLGGIAITFLKRSQPNIS